MEGTDFIMKRALMLASVASMIDQFNMGNINILKEMGYQVDVACNFEFGSSTSQERVNIFRQELIQNNIKPYHLPIPRDIKKLKKMFISYNLVKKIINQNNYDIIHCHSPIGGVIARLANRNSRNKGTKMIYTAHGFHFYKGAPLKNWLIYYPVERLLAKYTDVLIAINKEDFQSATSLLKVKRVEYLPGVGIDIDKFNGIEVDKELKRNQLGLLKDTFILLSVGELNKNKNQEVVIRALADINNTDIHYVICGKGVLEKNLKNLSKELGVENQVHFLGFRKDISEICKIVDLFVFPSYREGLSVALMEAMAAGLPIVCSNIRGNVDLINHGINGFLVEPHNVNGFTKYIDKIISDRAIQMSMSNKNLELVKNYDRLIIREEMNKIYGKLSN